MSTRFLGLWVYVETLGGALFSWLRNPCWVIYTLRRAFLTTPRPSEL